MWWYFVVVFLAMVLCVIHYWMTWRFGKWWWLGHKVWKIKAKERQICQRRRKMQASIQWNLTLWEKRVNQTIREVQNWANNDYLTIAQIRHSIVFCLRTVHNRLSKGMHRICVAFTPVYLCWLREQTVELVLMDISVCCLHDHLQAKQWVNQKMSRAKRCLTTLYWQVTVIAWVPS